MGMIRRPWWSEASELVWQGCRGNTPTLFRRTSWDHREWLSLTIILIHHSLYQPTQFYWASLGPFTFFPQNHYHKSVTIPLLQNLSISGHHSYQCNYCADSSSPSRCFDCSSWDRGRLIHPAYKLWARGESETIYHLWPLLDEES